MANHGWGSVGRQPFEEITKERWDYHLSVRMIPDGHGGQKIFSDCTHFCYSPSFWELALHDLCAQARRRRAHLTHLWIASRPLLDPFHTLLPPSRWSLPRAGTWH